MKKLVLITSGLILACLVISASVWEGAGTVSADGELPESGRYVATNSFPRNTMVDVINLETRQTVRAVVFSGLDSPGILAVVSKGAAEAIGLKAGSAGRIRMTMPGDPVAFSNFSGNSSGDPDFDSRAAVASEYPWLASPPLSASGGEAEVIPLGEVPAPGTEMTETAPPGEAPGANAAAEALEDTPLALEAERAAPISSAEFENGTDTVWVYPEEFIDGEKSAAGVPGIKEEESLMPSGATETPGITEAWETVPEASALAETPGATETPAVTEAWETVPEASALAETPAGTETPASAETPSEPGLNHLTLVPAEERPPDVSWFPVLGPQPVPESPLSPGAEAAALPLRETPPQNSVYFDAPYGNLEKGKYYLQLGAFLFPDSVNFQVSKIGKTYPLFIQKSGDTALPLYRVILGPFSQGESAAALERFKNTGYNDAFIRHE